MRDELRVLSQAAVATWAEFTAFYTWRTWTVTWLGRLLLQVCFYAVIGRMLQSPQRLEFLLIGNSVAIVAIDACVVIILTILERRTGTLGLMVAAPSTHVTVYLGRGLMHLISGIVAAVIALGCLTPLFGLSLPWPRSLVIPCLVAVTGFACYAYGTCIAAMVMRFPSARWIALNLSYLVLMTFCGVNVPVSFWPDWVQKITSALPLTHGLDAIRLLITDGDAFQVVAQTALELLVAIGWLVAAGIGFHLLVIRERKAGTLELNA
ncbi:ABC transporter permease [Amycolatopsis cihanbeyliensis]|uniref:ABC-2 type transport system permease protein n=1 Tax=Amycolatopsis cihanbeyliensis TaxID=1128664 RepID=A0A542DF37_AMYCI|nr:ABC transporter permease [Amycolatopsis cihanbeyliensis]TQJ01660.1 ABC-2 type transport system permease protein [Amycolatopsis cihanbeyliensis]